MAGAYGVMAKVGIGETSTVDKPLDAISDGVRLTTEIVDGNGLHGTRSLFANRAREARHFVAGPLVLNPTAVDWSNILKYILCGTPSGTSYPLGDTLDTFYYVADRVTKVFTYDGCGVARAVISSAPGEPLSCSMDIVGLSESVGNAGTFPAITIDMTTGFFMHQDLALTVNAVGSVKCKGFTLTIDNQIDADRFFNAQTMASVETMGRTVSLELLLPYGDQSASYDLSDAGVGVTAVYTNGATSLTFSMAKAQLVTQSPVATSRGEILFSLSGVCRATDTTTRELVTTLDSTP